MKYFKIAVFMSCIFLSGCNTSADKKMSDFEKRIEIIEGNINTFATRIEVCENNIDVISKGFASRRISAEDSFERNAGMDSANETEAETYQAKEKSPLSNTDIQTALQNAGYYSGSIDGKIGPNTERATREFQKNNGLTPDGVIGPKTENMLIKYLSQSLDQD